MRQLSTGHASNRSGGYASRSETPDIDLKEVVFGNVQATLYSDVADQAAQKIAGKDRRSQKNRPSQLRRFYDELVTLQGKVGSSAEAFRQQLPFIQMLKAKVAYALGREKVDVNYQALLRHVVDGVRDPETLKQAMLFMEAFMAFYKVYRPTD